MYNDDPDDYGADAAYDAAYDEREALIQEALSPLVDPVMDAVEALAAYIEEHGEQPHPWTRHRHLLSIWLDEDDIALREYLDEHFREEAEEIARDRDSGPCCYQFSCPCGNSNNFRGI